MPKIKLHSRSVKLSSQMNGVVNDARLVLHKSVAQMLREALIEYLLKELPRNRKLRAKLKNTPEYKQISKTGAVTPSM